MIRIPELCIMVCNENKLYRYIIYQRQLSNLDFRVQKLGFVRC